MDFKIKQKIRITTCNKIYYILNHSYISRLRTINTVDNAPPSAPGGVKYKGSERSDPHGASVRTRVEDM